MTITRCQMVTNLLSGFSNNAEINNSLKKKTNWVEIVTGNNLNIINCMEKIWLNLRRWQIPFIFTWNWNDFPTNYSTDLWIICLKWNIPSSQYKNILILVFQLGRYLKHFFLFNEIPYLLILNFYRIISIKIFK